jgi:putative hydrolase of HD superfamily
MQIDSKTFWNFVFEVGQLRNVRHEGWRLAGVENPESVAAHSLRASQIAYILAILEGHPNPSEVCSICVFHDLEETRIGDIQKVASRYVSSDKAQAVSEQVAPLGDIGQRVFSLWVQQEKRDTKAGTIAKDADYLDMAAMAKEYLERGYDYADDWIINIEKTLRTESAKQLMKELKSMSSCAWWQGLKKIS